MNNKQEILDKINSLEQELQKTKEYLNKIPNKSKEERMLEIWKSCNIIKYSKDNCRTYFNNNDPIFQQDFHNKKLYYRYNLVFKIFEKEYYMNTNDINSLVIEILSKDINCSTLSGDAVAAGWEGLVFVF